MESDFESATTSSHWSQNANSLNFGLLKNFLEVMKKEVNFENVKDLVSFMKFKLINEFITKLHLGLTPLIRDCRSLYLCLLCSLLTQNSFENSNKTTKQLSIKPKTNTKRSPHNLLQKSPQTLPQMFSRS